MLCTEAEYAAVGRAFMEGEIERAKILARFNGRAALGKDIHRQLASARGSLGVSQGTLAIWLKVTQQAISKWEKGTTCPSPEKLVRFATLVEKAAPDIAELFRMLALTRIGFEEGISSR